VDVLPPDTNNDVESPSPTRTAGSHCRLPTQHTTCAQELLPHLQIMDPRTWVHLFASIELYIGEDLALWRKMFPDPKTSPGHYTTTLNVGCTYTITAADAEASGWIRGFRASYTWKWPGVPHFVSTSQRYLSFHSTDSHPLSNLSTCTLPNLLPHGFLTLPFHSLFLKT